MRVVITKLTDVELMRKACSFTINKESKMSLDKIYRAMHSPMRTQLFFIEMYDIPTFCSVHLTRHSAGVTHFVKSNREDRGGEPADRNTPVNHAMLANAEAIINMARKRLCNQAASLTIELMQLIKDEMLPVDSDLHKYMVPECEFRGGWCYELKSCGRCLTAE